MRVFAADVRVPDSKIVTWSLVAAGSVSGALVIWYGSKWRKRSWYRKECEKIRNDRDRKISNLRQSLEALKLDEKRVQFITSLSLQNLVDKLKSGALTARETLHAYQWRAVQAHDLTNCLTNVFEDADEVAKRLDAEANKDGLLHGVPVSIKDSCPTKGHVNTKGCVVNRDVISEDDALLVKELRAQGAVPFVKTNIPQLMMGVESSNAIYGATCHPLDRTRTPGGSSGGEGALIAAGGSVLGLGSDIGGSIRIPSGYCGIYGLKTSSGRLSKLGMFPYGQTIVRPCWGPMARDVDSLVLTMRALLTPNVFAEDRTIPPMPFDMEQYSTKRRLTIGYYIDDGVLHTTPAVRRAVELAKSVLEARGHTLVAWTPPDALFAYDAFIRSISGDRGCLFKEMVRGDIIHESIESMKVAFMPSPLRYLLAKLIRWSGDHVLAVGVKASRGVGSVPELFRWTSTVELYCRKFRASWRESGLDAVICPMAPHPALKLSSSARNSVNTFYTGLYNLLDYAGGVVPVTTVTQRDIDNLSSFPRGTLFEKYLATDLQDSEGLPVTVQCVTPTWREELCLYLMKELQDGLQNTANIN